LIIKTLTGNNNVTISQLEITNPNEIASAQVETEVQELELIAA
jgi:hypothetical protein